MKRFIQTAAGLFPIEFGKEYAVLYSSRNGILTSYGCYLRRPDDPFIGKDDLYGCHGPRFYLDGRPQEPGVQVMRVMETGKFRDMTLPRLFKDEEDLPPGV